MKKAYTKRIFLKHFLSTFLFPIPAVSALSSHSERPAQSEAFFSFIQKVILRQSTTYPTYTSADIRLVLKQIDGQNEQEANTSLKDAISKEFHESKIIVIDGFIFSRTELLLCLIYAKINGLTHVI